MCCDAKATVQSALFGGKQQNISNHARAFFMGSACFFCRRMKKMQLVNASLFLIGETQTKL